MKLTKQEWGALLKNIKNEKENLTLVNLMGKDLDSKNVIELMNALIHNKRVKKLVLSANPRIDEKGLKAIINFLAVNNTLETLTLYNINISKEIYEEMGKTLEAHNTTLITFNSNRGVGSEAVYRAVSSNKTLGNKKTEEFLPPPSSDETKIFPDAINQDAEMAFTEENDFTIIGDEAADYITKLSMSYKFTLSFLLKIVIDPVFSMRLKKNVRSPGDFTLTINHRDAKKIFLLLPNISRDSFDYTWKIIIVINDMDFFSSGNGTELLANIVKIKIYRIMIICNSLTESINSELKQALINSLQEIYQNDPYNHVFPRIYLNKLCFSFDNVRAKAISHYADYNCNQISDNAYLYQELFSKEIIENLLTASKENDFFKSCQLMENIIKIEKGCPLIHYLYGGLHLRYGIKYNKKEQLWDAVKQYSLSIALEPENFDAYLFRAHGYFCLEHYYEAIIDYIRGRFSAHKLQCKNLEKLKNFKKFYGLITKRLELIANFKTENKHLSLSEKYRLLDLNAGAINQLLNLMGTKGKMVKLYHSPATLLRIVGLFVSNPEYALNTLPKELRTINEINYFDNELIDLKNPDDINYLIKNNSDTEVFFTVFLDRENLRLIIHLRTQKLDTDTKVAEAILEKLGNIHRRYSEDDGFAMIIEENKDTILISLASLSDLESIKYDLLLFGSPMEEVYEEFTPQGP